MTEPAVLVAFIRLIEEVVFAVVRGDGGVSRDDLGLLTAAFAGRAARHSVTPSGPAPPRSGSGARCAT